MKLTIVVPAYNEEKTIGQVLEKLAGLELSNWQSEVIVVDDGSTDNLKLKAENAKQQFKTQNLVVLSHEQNQGKGAAIKTALKYATGDYVIIQDADLEYNPADIPKLLAGVAQEKPGAVFGSRNIHPKRQGYPLYVLGAGLLTMFMNVLYGARLTDVYTGYKLVPLSILKSLNLQSHGFEFEAEVTAKLLKRHTPIVEVAIDYSPRSFAEGKKIRFRDAVLGFWTILKNRL